MVRQAVKDIVTQSEIMTRAACPRKWYYRYVLKLARKAGPNYPLIYGDLMHRALAELYKEGLYAYHPKNAPLMVSDPVIPDNIILTPTDRFELALIKDKVQIAFYMYRLNYHKTDRWLRTEAVEEVFNTKWRGVKLSGRIDLAAYPKQRDGLYIWDFKTAGRFDKVMLDVWSFRFQFLYYAWLYWRVTGHRPSGIMASGLAKTKLRPYKARVETREHYLARVRAHMLDHRDKYFYRQRMPFRKNALEMFEDQLLIPHLDVFKELSEPIVNERIGSALAMAMNTGQCHIYNSFCEYLPLCKDGPMMLTEYDKREEKHEELGGELGNG